MRSKKKLSERLGVEYPAFLEGLKRVCERFGIEALDLLTLVYIESRFDPQITAKNGAYGLFQFVRSTMAWLGFVPPLSVREQFSAYELFLVRMGYKSGMHIYSFNFVPAYEARGNYNISSESEYYKLNTGLDYDKDGVITRSDVIRFFEEKKRQFLSEYDVTEVLGALDEQKKNVKFFGCLRYLLIFLFVSVLFFLMF